MRSKRNRLGGGAHRTIEDKSPARKKFSLLSRGGFETLEVRSLLAVDGMGVSPWTNTDNRYDVNGNGTVEPADLLMLIDNINRVGARSLIASAQGGHSAGQLLGGSSGEGQSKAEYLDVNGDSEVTPNDALLVINSLNSPPPTARFIIDTLNLDKEPITSVAQNEAFLIRATVQDLLDPNDGPLFQGVFSAFMDIAYNSGLVSVAPIGFENAVQFDPAFNIGRSGNFDTTGLIDEIGAATQTPAPGQPQQLVFYVAMIPLAQGAATFTPQFATGTGHEVFVFGDISTPLPASHIDFVSSAPLTITAPNANPKANVTISDVTIAEENADHDVTFTVTLSNNNYDVQLRYDTANGTAVNSPTASRDYFSTSGILNFSAGGALTQTITVKVRGDSVAEATENFFVNLSSVLNATITDGQGVGTINDNDAPAGPTLSIGSPAAQNEGNSGTTTYTFPVTLSVNPTSNVTVVYTTNNGTATTADGDYAATSGTLTFTPGGALTRNVTVNVNGDVKDEANETFTVTLSNASGATVIAGTGTGTINDDDAAPSVSIGNVTQLEGNSGTSNFVFPVTLSAVSGQQVTVVFATTNGTATSGSDYAATSGTLTFAPGETSKSVTVVVNGDTTIEASETFTVGLSNPVNATGTPSGNGVISNDDLLTPSISINDVTTAENVGAGTQTFTVTLSQAGTSQITVVYATANGTATTADNDYTATSGTLTFAVGETSKTITVAIINDAKNEANETYTVNLSNVSAGATILDGSGLGTINNDDALPSLSIGDVTLAEGNSGTTTFTFPVTLSAASGQQVVVAFATSNGTATTGDNDYTATSGTLTFAPGETSKSVTVNVAGDSKSEGNETFNVNLSGATNATIGDNLGVGTITNDDAVPNVSINNDVTQTEGNSGTTNFVFTVTLSAASGQQVTVPFSTTNGSAIAPGDYAASSGTLTFAPGETSKTITVAVVGDLADEATTETFTVNLGTAVNANVTVATRTGTIQDDDGPPGLSIADLSQAEGSSGATNFNFVVTLAASSSQQITVVYTTSNGTATTGDNDYTATTGTVTFAPGETSKTATVVVNGDTKNEANENFTVTLSSPVNSTLTDGIATGTITNDDAQPTLTVGDATAQSEGNSGTTVFTFPVTLSAASGQQVTVVFATSNGTATAADGDYTATSSTLTFAPGETSKSVTVSVTGDSKSEANETFNVLLSNATNATIADGTGTTTINNDDAIPGLSIAGVSQAEGNSGTSNFGFIVTLGAASGQQVTVVFATANGTATAGSDYTATNGTLTFAPGETSKTINVAVAGDTLSEVDEAFTVNLSGAVNASVTTATATGNIVNDDAPPGLSIGNFNTTEGNASTKNFTFTVSLQQASGVATTVEFATGGGTATAGTDYTPTNGTLTFAPGETSKTITVTVISDTVNEANETFNVTLSNASAGTPISISTGVGTITNDDFVNASITDVSQSEGNSGPTNYVFGVTLSTASDQTVLIAYTTGGGTATAGTDYAATSGTLTFMAGETSKQITVAVNGDTTFENNETFNVTLSTTAAGVTLTKATGIGTITNEDTAPVFAIGDVSQAEGNIPGGTTDFVFQVTRTGSTELASTIVFATADGTAVTASVPNGRDYTATSGTLTFAPGETTKSITVKVRADGADENDETFTVGLSGATNATIGDASGLATIQNDDPDGAQDTSTLAGYVFIDTNNNGVKDAVEKPLAGVTITLTPDSSASSPGFQTYTVTTEADGTYKFEDVETGDYILTETQPGFYLDGADHVGTQGSTAIANDSFNVSLDGGLDYTGNIFAERGLRAEFISKRLMIASSYGSGQGFLSDVNLSQGAAWVSVDSGIDGILTVEANGTGAGNTTLTLYDNNLRQVATSTSADGDVRVDWTGTPGAPYFVRVSGSNTDVDVRLTNLVDIAAGIVTVHGTDGDDAFTFDASGSVHTFTINGVKYELNPANASRIVFEGGSGNDSVTLIDSAFDDSLAGGDDWLSLTNDHGLELTAFGIESARATSSHGGHDTSDLLAADFALELIGDWA